MRGVRDVSTRISCSEADRILEERLFEGALSPSKRRDFEQHVSECDRCRGLFEQMLRLQDCADEVSEVEIEAARRRVSLNRAEIPPSTSGRRTRATVAVAAAAAVVIATIVLNRPDAAKKILACRPSPVSAPVPGVRTTYCGEKPPVTTVDTDGTVRVLLETGTVGLDVDPRRSSPKPVVVESAAGEVRVKGTLFTVRAGANARLEVFRGTVEFRPAGGGTPRSVSEGEGAELLPGTVFSRSSFQTAPLRRALEAAAGHVAPSGPAVETISRDKGTKSSALSAPMLVDAVEPVASAEIPTPEPKPRTAAENAAKRAPTMDQLIQEAQSCLIESDWHCASQRYNEVLRRYPGRPESAAVSVSLARLELRVLHEPQEALRHYLAYRRQAPNGVLAEEALLGIAAAYRAMGNRAEEEKALGEFIERFPENARRSQAVSRLRRLERAERSKGSRAER